MSAELMLPWGMVVLGALLGVIMDRLARLRRPDGERGDYWSRIVFWYLYPLAGLLLLSQVLTTLSGWPAGWRLSYWITLLLPFIGWALALLVGLAVKPAGREQARWLAGGAGFGNSRYWLLWCALPLASILAFEAGDLGGGESAYPAAVWSTLAVVALTLVGIAFSAGRAPLTVPAAESLRTEAAGQLQPWPELLAAHGIQVQTLVTWPAGAPVRAVRGASAQGLADRLHSMGAQAVAPELIEVIAALLEPEQQGDDYGSIRLVFAPDGCGQVEVVGLAAALLDQRIHAVTLVVTAREAAGLTRQLQRWLPEAAQRIVTLERSEIQTDALLWVTDAEFLSDRLLTLLKDPQLVRRIGLVVWWQLQDYTGVMAANLWAITRRLHRLLRSQGRHDVRTLALLRRVSHPDAQMGNFVRRLLPHPLPPRAETHVEPRLPHPVSLHLLEAQPVSLNRRSAPENTLERQYLLLQAGAASVAGGWPTYLEPPEFISAPELAQFQQAAAGAMTLGERLCLDPAAAAARLLQVQSAELLALPEMLGQGGRTTVSDLPHHVGMMPPANPYVTHLLGMLKKGEGFPASRRLVCAEACPAIIRRHLLLALNELPDTRRGLLQNALWDEQVVREILQDLAKAGQLTRREVRFLDDSDRLVSEWEYQSLRIPPGQYRPLDTVGLNLLEVRERAGDVEGEGVRLRVDPERLLIKAYPRRVFMHQGQRYRIRDWNSLREVTERGWLECQREDQCSTTWRIHNAFVFRIRPLPGETAVAIGRQGRLTRLAVDLSYEEEVTGVIEWTPDSSRRPLAEPQRSFFNPITRTFDTRALVLRLLEPPLEPNALPSLCLALRHLLPVHLGVEEEALEVVTLSGEDIDGEETFGVAVVDLYPGGIGLIDAIHDDNTLLLHLLEWTRNWLAVCPEEALQTPAAQATNPDQPPQRAAALKLLDYVI